MQNKPVHFHLSQAALTIVQRRAPSPNKRGAWISEAIQAYDRLLAGQETENPARLAKTESEVNETRVN